MENPNVFLEFVVLEWESLETNKKQKVSKQMLVPWETSQFYFPLNSDVSLDFFSGNLTLDKIHKVGRRYHNKNIELEKKIKIVARYSVKELMPWIILCIIFFLNLYFEQVSIFKRRKRIKPET